LIIDTTSISRARRDPNNDGVDILPFVRILGSSAPRDLTVQCLDTRDASEIIKVILSLAKSYSAWQHLISVLDIQELRLSITADWKTGPQPVAKDMRFNIVVSRDSRPFEEQTALVSLPPLVLRLLPPLVLRPRLQHLTEFVYRSGLSNFVSREYHFYPNIVCNFGLQDRRQYYRESVTYIPSKGSMLVFVREDVRRERIIEDRDEDEDPEDEYEPEYLETDAVPYGAKAGEILQFSIC
jgi:hypothetical protein